MTAQFPTLFSKDLDKFFVGYDKVFDNLREFHDQVAKMWKRCSGMFFNASIHAWYSCDIILGAAFKVLHLKCCP